MPVAIQLNKSFLAQIIWIL